MMGFRSRAEPGNFDCAARLTQAALCNLEGVRQAHASLLRITPVIPGWAVIETPED